jgi:SAM-dependent methyltransferase
MQSSIELRTNLHDANLRGGVMSRFKLYKPKQALFNLIPALGHVFEFNRTSRDRWIAREASNISFGSAVLDIGAGSAPYRRFFKQCFYRTHDFGGLNNEQLRGRKGYSNIDIISDINNIPVPTSSVDVVLCTEVIEHVPEPIAAVQEMGRLLRPGGLLLLSAPLRSGLHQEPYHFYGGYTPHWYKKHLTTAGFKDIEVRAVGGLLKAYAEESIRVAMQLSPFSKMATPTKVAVFPFWLATVAWFGFLCPLLFTLLDSVISNEAFSVGYHVRAIKSSDVLPLDV